MRVNTENSLKRDKLFEVEQMVTKTNKERDTLTVESSIEFDYSEAYFPKLSRGPVTFQGSSFTNDVTSQYKDLRISNTILVGASNLLNS